MKLKHYRTIMRHGVLWLLALLSVPFMSSSEAAAARITRLDVARIDAFVRDQVQRHGIPGLALALVEGDQIIDLQGFGVADQSGQPSHRKRRSCWPR